MDTNSLARPPAATRSFVAAAQQPSSRMVLGAVLGAALGSVIGFLGAPAWEMAFIVVCPVAAVCGAAAGALAARSGLAAIGSLLVSAACAGGMALLASSNPAWVIQQCATAVFASGALSAGTTFLLGWSARRVAPARR